MLQVSGRYFDKVIFRGKNELETLLTSYEWHQNCFKNGDEKSFTTYSIIHEVRYCRSWKSESEEVPG